jgi:hypothetical protein
MASGRSSLQESLYAAPVSQVPVWMARSLSKVNRVVTELNRPRNDGGLDRIAASSFYEISNVDGIWFMVSVYGSSLCRKKSLSATMANKPNACPKFVNNTGM